MSKIIITSVLTMNSIDNHHQGHLKSNRRDNVGEESYHTQGPLRGKNLTSVVMIMVIKIMIMIMIMVINIANPLLMINVYIAISLF